LDDNRSASIGVSETFSDLSADEHLPGHSHNKVSKWISTFVGSYVSDQESPYYYENVCVTFAVIDLSLKWFSCVQNLDVNKDQGTHKTSGLFL